MVEVVERQEPPDETLHVPAAQLSAAPSRRGSSARMVAWYAVTVFFLITVNFFLPRVVPGDPIEAQLALGTSNPVDEDTRAELAQYYGLDDPLVEQFGHYLVGLAQGDLGQSIRHNAPVVDLLAQRLPWTVLLVGSSMALAATVGLAAGVHSAWHRGRAADQGLLIGFLAASSIPPFFLGSVALFVLSVKLGWFPLAGARTAFVDHSGPFAALGDILHHLVLPAAVLALVFLLTLYLVMRSSMVGELGSDYLLVGRAKGLRERRLKYGYAARNAMLPVVTEVALLLGVAIPIGIFVEQVFAYPGLGQLLVDSAFNRDYPLMQGSFLLLSLLVVTLNLLADLLNFRLDPRTRA
ncbi:MAG: ABC transporter permease [Actinomycetota bacterium]|nr:ABC transporter permease [Actinomycetota bacterium]